MKTQNTNTLFTKTQLKFAITNWKLEPFTSEEQNFLSETLLSANSPKEHSYGQNDIESFILETLSEMDA